MNNQPGSSEIVPGIRPSPAASRAPAPSAPVHTSAFQIDQHEVLDTIDIGVGNSFEPEGNEQIIWMSLDVKGATASPLVVDLSNVMLTADGARYKLRGVGFGGSDPSIQHLIDPAIIQSGTVTTSGPAVGEVVYHTGAKQVTFQKLPSRMSFMFLVASEPASMQLEGLPGGAIKVK